MPFRRVAKKLINQQGKTNYAPYNFVELSRQALLNNVSLIQSKNPGQSVIPVVKGNAYGHGIHEVAEVLNSADLDFIAVDGYFEASNIINITKHQILVMGAVKPENVRLLNISRCSFVIQDTQTLAAFGKLNRPVRVHIELNSGMQRLGLADNEIDDYLSVFKNYPKLQLEGIMSHLADADNPNDSFTRGQQRKFESQVEYILSKGFEPRFIHLAQTAGSTKTTSKYTNAIRLGIGLYGLNPLSDKDPHQKDLIDLQPVLQLKSTIIKVQQLQKGDRVSYNGIFTAPKAMRIGILPLGYYEGYPRELSNSGVATYNGKPLPVIGRVCMNHTIIDLGDTPANTGSEIILISHDPTALNSVQNISAKHGLYIYTLVTQINENIRRVII